jgi:hypothetical protein
MRAWLWVSSGPLDRDEARAAALSGEIEGLLRWYPAHPGDTFFVPAGTVHAIGAGLALCEIQQYSDVTYRLYDYGRPRELHLDAALAVADLGCHPGPARLWIWAMGGGCWRSARTSGRSRSTVAASCIGRLWPRAELLVCLEGDGRFGDEAFAPGQVWVVPAERTISSGIRSGGGARLPARVRAMSLKDSTLASSMRRWRARWRRSVAACRWDRSCWRPRPRASPGFSYRCNLT